MVVMLDVLLILAGVVLIGGPLYLLHLAAERGNWRQALREFVITALAVSIIGGLAVAGFQLIRLGVERL